MSRGRGASWKRSGEAERGVGATEVNGVDQAEGRTMTLRTRGGVGEACEGGTSGSASEQERERGRGRRSSWEGGRTASSSSKAVSSDSWSRRTRAPLVTVTPSSSGVPSHCWRMRCLRSRMVAVRRRRRVRSSGVASTGWVASWSLTSSRGSDSASESSPGRTGAMTRRATTRWGGPTRATTWTPTRTGGTACSCSRCSTRLLRDLLLLCSAG